MQFYVYSRNMAEIMEPHDAPHIIVSINCPGEEPARIKTNEHTLGRSNHFFWDLDGPVAGVCEDECQLVSDDDADRIVDLVMAHPDAWHFVVHCTAGKSRSAAVAAAIMYCLTGSDKEIFDNAKYRPNMRVYRKVVDAWMRKHP